ncbi:MULTISPECIES: hypothetical protein [unclassified Duganella]|nr:MULTISPECIES: hypothetical protein [unclassified Duganella]
MSQKRWSYQQLTQSAETAITNYNEMARNVRMDGDPVGVASMFHQRAIGALETWRDLTMGWQENDDDARLTALAMQSSSVNI